MQAHHRWDLRKEWPLLCGLDARQAEQVWARWSTTAKPFAQHCALVIRWHNGLCQHGVHDRQRGASSSGGWQGEG